MGSDSLDGKVGRMYVPRQEVGSIALRKMKVGRSCLQRVHGQLCGLA